MGISELLQFVQIWINFYKQRIKMHIKSVSCVVALLFAVANARYTGVGPAGACSMQCSPDQFFQYTTQCNRGLYSGYPYQNTGQCMSNVDQWIGCMQMTFGKCLPWSCTQWQGMQQFMPITNRFMNVNSLNGIYQAIDETISDIFAQWNVQLPPHFEQIRRNGVANLLIPFYGHEGVTVSQYIQEMICPVPGQMPRSFQKLLPIIQSGWEMLSATGVTDTSAYVPFCDGDFTSYIVNNVLDLLQGFYSATSRGQYCSMQSAAASFVDTILNKKCNFGPLFSQVGIPSSVTAMLKNAGQAMYQQTGCSANQMYSSSYYQTSNYQSPSYYNNKYGYSAYGVNWSNIFQGMDWTNMLQGMDWTNMFQGINWNNMDWSNMFQGMGWNNMNWSNLFQGMWNNQGYNSNQEYSNNQGYSSNQGYKTSGGY